jgi:coenzyme F420-0:L-glutamate ligase/coenzyme F420-1:gamma-L-glutamate ligase
MSLQVVGVPGIGEVTSDTDLPAAIGAALELVAWPDGSRGVRDGDIVVVTSKIVSKAEGRFIPAEQRDEALAAEATAIVATKVTPRGTTQIVRTHHGLVLAAAGIDASNVPSGYVLLLPRDPDASARALRQGLRELTGLSVGVVVTDTMGRAWRSGLTDSAIGVAGVTVLDDLRGLPDAQGRPMEATVIAIADEVAAAADLVKGKSGGVPVAVVRGLSSHVSADDGPGAVMGVRALEEDLFSLGSAEARQAGRRDAVLGRRTVRRFTDDVVDPGALERAICRCHHRAGTASHGAVALRHPRRPPRGTPCGHARSLASRPRRGRLRRGRHRPSHLTRRHPVASTRGRAALPRSRRGPAPLPG